MAAQNTAQSAVASTNKERAPSFAGRLLADELITSRETRCSRRGIKPDDLPVQYMKGDYN
jgi:hypothetical protein